MKGQSEGEIPNLINHNVDDFEAVQSLKGLEGEWIVDQYLIELGWDGKVCCCVVE